MWLSRRLIIAVTWALNSYAPCPSKLLQRHNCVWEELHSMKQMMRMMTNCETKRTERTGQWLQATVEPATRCSGSLVCSCADDKHRNLSLNILGDKCDRSANPARCLQRIFTCALQRIFIRRHASHRASVI